MFDRNRAEDVEFQFLRLVLVANDALCIFISAAAEKTPKFGPGLSRKKKKQTGNGQNQRFAHGSKSVNTFDYAQVLNFLRKL